MGSDTQRGRDLQALLVVVGLLMIPVVGFAGGAYVWSAISQPSTPAQIRQAAANAEYAATKRANAIAYDEMVRAQARAGLR